MKHLYDSNFWNTENVARANLPVQAYSKTAAPVGAKLLPQIYSLGFLNPDVEYFS